MCIKIFWTEKSDNYNLADNQADIWMLLTNQHLDKLDYLYKILSDDEKQRADRYYFSKDKNKFTITRATLRILLAKYLDTKPEKIEFTYNEYGKPLINNLQFNVSHSGDVAIYIFSKTAKVGIDVEYMRDKIAYREISKRFFSEHEVKALEKIPENLQKEAFFNGWTRKEAYIKIKGKGLAIPLDSFDVSLEPGIEARIIDSRDDDIHYSNWKIYDIPTKEAYKAALIVEKTVSNLNFYNY